MSYDTDKTGEVLEELRTAVREDKIENAMQLLRFADGAGTLRRDSGMLPALQRAIGEKHAQKLIQAFATDACPYCNNGREKCDDCGGKGWYAGSKVCAPCAGLGLKRCPFCNGTGFAGYDFVPRGLRPIVMLVRTDFAAKQISAAEKFGGAKPTSRELKQRIVAIDRCRGVLANAVEQSRLGEIDGRSGLESSDRARVKREAKQQNQRAEKAIRVLLGMLAELYAERTERQRESEQRGLLAHRAKVFGRLSAGESLESSSLRTPAALKNV